MSHFRFALAFVVATGCSPVMPLPATAAAHGEPNMAGEPYDGETGAVAPIIVTVAHATLANERPLPRDDMATDNGTIPARRDDLMIAGAVRLNCHKTASSPHRQIYVGATATGSTGRCLLAAAKH